MEGNSSNPISYWLQIERKYLADLGDIRHWENLKLAFDSEECWVKDFTKSQIESAIVKAIPFKKLYYTKDNLLFPLDSLIPAKKIPSALLWSPIMAAIPLELPEINPPYFGTDEKIQIKLVNAGIEQKANALLITLDQLKTYAETAPAIRFAPLTWVQIAEDFALILGTPLLPLQGMTFWQYQSFLIPTGYHFEPNFLMQELHNQINLGKNDWILWHTDNSFTQIDKQLFKPLSLSSVRLS